MKVKRPLSRVRELLEATARRLAHVTMEERDFADVLARYDSPATFFYLDPPYVTFPAECALHSAAARAPSRAVRGAGENQGPLPDEL